MLAPFHTYFAWDSIPLETAALQSGSAIRSKTIVRAININYGQISLLPIEAVCQLHPFLAPSDLATFTQILVTARLRNGYVIDMELSFKLVQKSQLIHNMAVRLLTGTTT